VTLVRTRTLLLLTVMLGLLAGTPGIARAASGVAQAATSSGYATSATLSLSGDGGGQIELQGCAANGSTYSCGVFIRFYSEASPLNGIVVYPQRMTWNAADTEGYVQEVYGEPELNPGTATTEKYTFDIPFTTLMAKPGGCYEANCTVSGPSFPIKVEVTGPTCKYGEEEDHFCNSASGGESPFCECEKEAPLLSQQLTGDLEHLEGVPEPPPSPPKGAIVSSEVNFTGPKVSCEETGVRTKEGPLAVEVYSLDGKTARPAAFTCRHAIAVLKRGLLGLKIAQLGEHECPKSYGQCPPIPHSQLSFKIRRRHFILESLWDPQHFPIRPFDVGWRGAGTIVLASRAGPAPAKKIVPHRRPPITLPHRRRPVTPGL